MGNSNSDDKSGKSKLTPQSHTFSVYIREDEIFTGEESVFTLHFPTKEKMREYFPHTPWDRHEFFVRTDVQKPVKTKIIVRIGHPETNKFLVMYAKISKYGNHPTKPEQKGLYYKLVNLTPPELQMIQEFIK